MRTATDTVSSPPRADRHSDRSSLVRRFRASTCRLALAVLWLPGAGTAVAIDVHIQGRVVDQGGLPLPGVALRLVPATGAGGQATVSGGDGSFAFVVAAGAYRLEARLDGFEPLSRDIRADGPLSLPDLVMALARLAAETTVVAMAPTEVQPRQFGTPATIAEQVIDNAPRRNNRYDDVLPLLPNVVRGPDGLVAVAGARAPQGIVLTNGAPSSDVASGDPVAVIPLGAVESVQVLTTGFPAEFGPATGGVTVINSRAGSDSFKFAFNSFIPRPRIDDDGFGPIESWNPNISLRGPIARGRAWFAQSFDYHFEKTKAETVAGAQDRQLNGWTTFTQIDAKPASGHVVTGWVAGQDEHVEAERLGAFTPVGTVPNLQREVWSGAVIDRAVLGTSTLETRVDARHQEVSLLPAGSGAYLVGHAETRGSYFEAVNRRAMSVSASSVFSRASTGALGRHLVKAGASVARRQLDGVGQSQPATYLRSNLTPALLVTFVGSGVYEAASIQFGAFAQDTLEVNHHLTLDAGFRVDYDSRAGTFAAPRGGLTWRVADGTTLTAGAGWFAGDMRLDALAFGGYQSRRITEFDEAGLQAETTLYRNVLSTDVARPRAGMWSVRLDHRLGAGWQLRTGLQERQGSHEATVDPTVVASDAAALLTTNGRSRSRSLEITLGYHPLARQHQLYFSYVRSASTGNTNDFGQLDGLFREPRFSAAEEAPLPAAVPHRALVWGLVSLPRQVTVAPFLDVRSGFPFSPIYDDWTYAGPRFSQRYPVFASLDVVATKIVTLPHGYRARVGIKLYNIAGRRNGREIQADIERPDFGRTYNALGRQIRWVFEIIWSGTKT
jgi:hypothetical protein